MTTPITSFEVTPRDSLERFPRFMILGPQRTGTGWLREQLCRHPEIRFPSRRETHFFCGHPHPEDRTLGRRDDRKRLADYLSMFRHSPASRWCAVFRETQWGEKTACYLALTERRIREIHSLRPDLKAVVLIRDPVERAWSHAKKDLLRNRKREYVPELDDEFLDFFRGDYLMRCGRYVENLDRWASVFGAKSLFVGWFVDIAHRPAELLIDVMDFLRVGTSWRPRSSRMTRKVSATDELPLPPSLRAALEEIHRDDRSALIERFGRCG